MTIEKFNETKAIVEEIQTLEKFIPVFDKAYRSTIVAEEHGNEMGMLRKYEYPLRLSGDVNAKVLKVLEDRLEYLKDVLEEV